ncbi:cytochrome P450 4B1-like [Mixophyes fleayi]|uniref:cytochrome P450 4B1-like n=1 Tax=Mixophyes fleayi TaxID=3061075 RepID=UPI003F4D81B6
MVLSDLLRVPFNSLSVPEICRWAAWLFLLTLLFKGFKLYLNWKVLEKALKDFPGPKCHWLYGNALEFLKAGKNMEIFVEWAQTYKYGMSMWLGKFFAALLITHPDYAKAILVRHDPKDDVAYRFIVPWVGDGLLVTSGKRWFHRRRLLTPAFHYDVLKPYLAIMGDCTKTMLDKWERLIPDKKPIEVSNDISLMALDTIMKCAFSYDSNCQTKSENAYIKAIYDILYSVDQRFRNFMHHSDFLYYLSPQGTNFRRAVTIAHDHTDKVIKLRKESLKCEKEVEKVNRKRHLDFLDILLQAKDEFGEILPDKDLRSEVETFMFAGHDTTSAGFSWISYCMGKYPEHQEKCYEEIREVMGDRDTVEWEDLGKMPYTSMFIKESLRLYPPVPGVARKLGQPITFCDGRSLPEGSLVIISLYCINRSADIWKDPEVFDPLRFSVENTTDRHPHGFLPFSAGPRNCIGQNFAMNEMKVATALLLKRFQIRADPENEPHVASQVLLRSLNGINLYLKKREE